MITKEVVLSQLLLNSQEESAPPSPTHTIPKICEEEYGTENKEPDDSVPLMDIPLMMVSFMLSQVLMFSLLTVLYQSTPDSGPLATLCIHLVAMVLWSAQFVWCAWMLNCPVLDL